MSAPRRDLIDFPHYLDAAGSYLSIDDDNDTDLSPFDTLWTEFARSHPRLSPPGSPTIIFPQSAADGHPTYCSHAERPTNATTTAQPTIDVRALEYVADYDTNLMCPICHIPFIDPVVLDCDHIFCRDCFDTYRSSGSSAERSRCPACRTYHLGGTRRANRLIRNMASEVRVRCPNSGCDTVLARSNVEKHATKECPEQDLACPITTCSKLTKRKNFVQDACIHESHIDCECGASIRLGRGEWIRHRDEQCPLTARVASQALSRTNSNGLTQERCPGQSYGCTYDATNQGSPTSNQDFINHVSTCALSKLAPFLQKQETLVKSLQQSLDQQTRRNEILESGIDRLSEIITNTIQPKLDQVANLSSRDQVSQDSNDATSEIEEIPRSPADLRYYHQLSSEIPNLSSHLALLTNLEHRLTSLESQHHAGLTEVSRSLRDLDARTSLSIMNETLRIREDLAHLNGGMYSTRAQVTYLLNHHRITNQQHVLNGTSRTHPGGNFSVNAGASQAGSTSAGTTTQPQSQNHLNAPHPSSSTNTNAGASTSTGSTTSTSTSTSPMFSATRPNLRRGSGGGSRSSLDRVKL